MHIDPERPSFQVGPSSIQHGKGIHPFEGISPSDSLEEVKQDISTNRDDSDMASRTTLKEILQGAHYPSTALIDAPPLLQLTGLVGLPIVTIVKKLEGDAGKVRLLEEQELSKPSEAKLQKEIDVLGEKRKSEANLQAAFLVNLLKGS